MRPPIKVIKCSLKRIAEDDEVIEIILSTAANVTKISRLSQTFIKKYGMTKFAENEKFVMPLDDEEFLLECARTICDLKKEHGNTKTNMKRKNELKEFYNTSFKHLIESEGIPYWTNMTQIMGYVCESMKTNYMNNIVANFVSYVCHFVNAFYSKDQETEKWRKEKFENQNIIRAQFDGQRSSLEEWYKTQQTLIKCQNSGCNSRMAKDALKSLKLEFDGKLNKLKEKRKNDLHEECEKYQSKKRKFGQEAKRIKDAILERKPDKLPEDIKVHYKKIMPQHEFDRPDDANEDVLNWDLKVNTLLYFPSMIYMMDFIEKLPGWTLEINGRVIERHYKLLNVYPLRTCVKNCNFKLDTFDLIGLLYHDEVFDIGTKLELRNDIEEKKEELWGFYFDMDKRPFRLKGYTFNHSIITDGISCSIMFLRDDLYKKQKEQHEKDKKKKLEKKGRGRKTKGLREWQ